MARLRINLDDMIQALSVRLDLVESAWYLDLQTGDILLDSEETCDEPLDLTDNARYREIEPATSHEAFQIMQAFIAILDNPRMAAHLTEALAARKPFRRFKDALLDAPSLRESWFAFERAALRKLAGQWCENLGIDPEWI